MEGGTTYGRQGTPVAMFAGKLGKDLLEELHKVDIFACPEEELEGKGFNRCVDYPHIPTHKYYEGYFHSFETSESVASLEPRHRTPATKPAAPPLLRAVYITFREENKEWLRGIAEELRTYSSPDGEKGEKVMDSFASMFDPDGELKERVLGDLAVQVHFGAPIQGRNIGWHFDAMNSALHFAFGVRGKRSLHSSRAKTPEDALDYEYGEPYVDPQEEGDVYLSSPSSFRHGVEYPESSWEDRTTAVQARFLFKLDELNMISKNKSENEERFLGGVVSKALLVGPTLPSTEAVMKTYAALLAKEEEKCE